MNSNYTSGWKKEEIRIYKRDILFLLLVIFFSVVISELFILKKDTLLVDRIFSYLLVFIPLGTINLIAHYIYRNSRIRATGNLRSSMRYRLSLVFMIVAIIPSIPIFLISSNVVDRLVEGFFGVNITSAMDSAKIALEYYNNEEAEQFYQRIRLREPTLFRGEPMNAQSVETLFITRVIERDRDYAALFKGENILYESSLILAPNERLEILKAKTAKVTRVEKKIHNLDVMFYIYPLDDPELTLVIGHRLHPGLEKHLNRFYSVEAHYKDDAGSRYSVPTTLRLALGLVYLFMIFFALVMALVVAHQISMPVVSLAAAAREIAEGHLDTRLDIKAQGEIGILIDSFNQMTQELETLRTRLLHSQRMAAWQEVARRLAHEIRNPLTPIQLAAERMLRRLSHPEKGKLDEVVKMGASTIIDQVNVLKILVTEFSEFARLPVAKPVMNSLDSIVSEAVNLYRNIRGIEIELKLAGNLPLIPIDKNIIIGMINNILKNGVEAIEQRDDSARTGSDRIRITTENTRRGARNYVLLKIEDSGPGIDPENYERVFEPYFSTKGEHGSGLGLSFVERAVHDHDGRLVLGRSSVLGGAEFRIFFPVHSFVENLRG